MQLVFMCSSLLLLVVATQLYLMATNGLEVNMVRDDDVEICMYAKERELGTTLIEVKFTVLIKMKRNRTEYL